MNLGILLRLAEGLCLLALGFFSLHLSLSDTYSMFLNPRFAWLTGTAGAGLVAFGVLRLTTGGGRGAPFRLVVFLALLALTVLSQASLSPSPGVVAAGGNQHRKAPRTMERDGTTYTKINPAVLFYLVREDKYSENPGPYVAQGVARRGDDLAPNRFYLVRMNMVCCAADAVGLGLVVELPAGVEMPEDGRWVRVYGTLAELNPKGKLAAAPPPEGRVTSLVSRKAFLKAKALEGSGRPAVPYVFVLGAEPPYQF